MYLDVTVLVKIDYSLIRSPEPKPSLLWQHYGMHYVEGNVHRSGSQPLISVEIASF